RDHDVLPRDVKVFQRLPENLFALTLRVIVRRINEVDAAVDGRLDQFIGPGLANAADALEDPSAVPERHGSEAESRNQETSIAERCVFHDVLFLVSNVLPSGHGAGRWPDLTGRRSGPTSRHRRGCGASP